MHSPNLTHSSIQTAPIVLSREESTVVQLNIVLLDAAHYNNLLHVSSNYIRTLGDVMVNNLP